MEKNFDVQNVVSTYCQIAGLKERQHTEHFGFEGWGPAQEVEATHVFGAQQLAWLYWSESEIKLDIMKVNALLAFHSIEDIWVPAKIGRLIDEFDENLTEEARFAHFCCALEDFLQTMCVGAYTDIIAFIKKQYGDLRDGDKVSDEKFDALCKDLCKWMRSVIFCIEPISTKVIQFAEQNYPEFLADFDVVNQVVARYCILSELKSKVRMGWNYWRVKVSHREVVSEHAFGTQPLAWLIHLATKNDVDIYKVSSMLALHETEESVMPDFTPYDPITPEQMLEMGDKSVQVVFGGLKRYKLMAALLDEFNAKATPEGKFAYLCDKLECNFRCKMYSDLGLCSIEGGSEAAKNDPEIILNISRGAKTVSDLFLMHEMPKYVGTPFEAIANCLKEFDTTQV